jgi:23S rRNA pseudouridine1911/1915/1917 synthase
MNDQSQELSPHSPSNPSNCLDVLYFDNHLLVVNKPAGLLTQPNGTSEKSLEDYCKEWLKCRLEKPGNVFLEAVHRLDRPVSGVVVFAKTSKALSRLNQFQREHNFQKIYRVIVEGSCSSQGVLENYLIHQNHFAKIVEEPTVTEKDAKYCRLDYRLIQKNERISLLEIELKTGRYHQIRAQLAHVGWPVLGDRKYGSTLFELLQNSEQIALHHQTLTILHPIHQQKIECKTLFTLEEQFF